MVDKEKSAEQKNLEVKLKLTQEIHDHADSIVRQVEYTGKALFDTMRKVLSTNEYQSRKGSDPVTISAELWEELWQFMSNMNDISKFGYKNSTIKDYQQKIQIKQEVLKTLS